MSLNPRAIATLGVGFGALSVAYLGLWPIDVTPPEPPQPPIIIGPPSGFGRPPALGLVERIEFRDDQDLLETISIFVEILNSGR